jgi:hypothetical protein
MRKFDYRAPRFAVDLPVRITFGESVQQGRCKEISTEGMKLELRDPLSPGASGSVRLSYQDVFLDIQVRVAHSGPTYDGVRFVYESEDQRDELSRLVARLAGAKQRLGPVLVR